MIKQHMYVIAVRDLHEAASYYRDVLGFSIKEIGDDGWRLFERDGCRMLRLHSQRIAETECDVIRQEDGIMQFLISTGAG